MRRTKKQISKEELIRNELSLWYLRMFPPMVIKTEPRTVVFAEGKHNPRGEIVPPNTPVMAGRKL